MVMPNLVVMLRPSAPVADVDTVATHMLMVLAAGPSAEGLAALVSHTHVVFNNMEDQGQPIERSLMDVVGILPPARQMAGVARGLNGAPWRSDP